MPARFQPSRLFAHLGIRASLLLGIGTMAVVMVLSVSTALMGTSWMSRATRDILSDRMPGTVQILRVARATDSLVAASGAFASVTTRPALTAAVQRVEQARESLATALDHLARAPVNTDAVRRLTKTLGSTFDRLHPLAERRVALQAASTAARARLGANRQVFHRHLTHRVRVLDGDSDVLRLLLSRPDPPQTAVMALAAGNAELLPVARFYGEVESLHARLLAASLEQNVTALDIAQQTLTLAFEYADRTFVKLPESVKPLVAPAYQELTDLALSDEGLTALRRQELATLTDIRALIGASQRISDMVDAATAALTERALDSINQAAATADDVRHAFSVFLAVMTGLSALLVGALLVFHVNRNLIRRLAGLSDAMQAIAAGRFETPLPPTGPDELGRLGAAVHRFHATAIEATEREAALRASTATAETARRALEGKTLELQEINQKLSRLSVQDGLTGLGNRRRFDEVLEMEWARGRRFSEPLALIMLDVDFFKQFNDFYGHQAGDECLRRVAGVLQGMARRAGDVVARYGGEEFCVLLPATDLETARVIAEAMRVAIETMNVPHGRSSFERITASFGVAAAVPDETLTADALLNAADTALYDAKGAGRNQIAFAPPLMTTNADAS